MTVQSYTYVQAANRKGGDSRPSLAGKLLAFLIKPNSSRATGSFFNVKERTKNVEAATAMMGDAESDNSNSGDKFRADRQLRLITGAEQVGAVTLNISIVELDPYDSPLVEAVNPMGRD